ncbi:hypothetical protein BH09BAC1_BH09BAC1_19220 [soil metagenome]
MYQLYNYFLRTVVPDIRMENGKWRRFNRNLMENDRSFCLYNANYGKKIVK